MTTTPLDPAIAVTKFVLALTTGVELGAWKRAHADATSRLRNLELDRDRWIRTGTTLRSPIPPRH